MEATAISMGENILGFLTPVARWSIFGFLLTAWSGLGWIQIIRWVRKRKERTFPWAGLFAIVYVLFVVYYPPVDFPDDLYFSRAFDEVSYRIERREQMSFGASVNRYFQRTGNRFPLYRIAIDPDTQTFLITQSEIHPFTDALTLVDQWRLIPGPSADAYRLESTKHALPVTQETAADSATLEELTKNFTCETDEPFPSCFRLLYQGQEIFSHDSRSVVVADTEISPDGRWLLLLLSMRYSGNEYLYLVDLQNEPT